MSTTKTFEIRDRMTLIPALAIRLDPKCEGDRHLFARGGFGTRPEDQRRYVLFMDLEDYRIHWDPLKWRDRTMSTAHNHVLANWDELESGQVLDVEYILRETSSPKVSESVS